MTKVAYLECPTGIAGDMCLGALVDVGVPLDYLEEQLKGLGLEGEYQLHSEKVHRRGQVATKVDVDLLIKEDHHHRHLPEIEGLIQGANLPHKAQAWSLQVFRQLAVAEGAVHGISPEKVHFHEVGATDALVDIVGTCLGLEWLGVEEIYCSALPMGGGTVTAAHGVLPVPVPAVLKLWESRQVPVYHNGLEMELVTPTGAALAVTLAMRFGPPPPLQLRYLGLGAGSKDLGIPNILRLWVGEKLEQGPEVETVAVLETQIDDLNPQAIAYTGEVLLGVGALDVFTQSIGMKKSRSGVLLTVVCPLEKVTECERIIFEETTTLGIRYRTQIRHVLAREMQEVSLPSGKVRVKVARLGDRIVNVQPEYEDCAQVARAQGQPWRVIYQKVMEAFGRFG